MIWAMNTKIPPISVIKGRLEALTYSDMQGLAVVSDVPFTTLWKIRSGETSNPGIETVRKFALHFGKFGRKAEKAAA